MRLNDGDEVVSLALVEKVPKTEDEELHRRNTRQKALIANKQ